MLRTDAGVQQIASAVAGFAAFSLRDGGYAFEGVVDDAGRAELARRLVGGGIAVHGLGIEQRDLETVFREVSAGTGEEANDAN